MIKKILVVEDERDILLALSTKLESEGYTVIQSTSYPDAYAKFTKENPDLVLLDIIIIGKSGIDFLKEIREKLQSHVPVIVSSNVSEQSYIDSATKYGISGYIIKSSISLEDIVNKIKELPSS